MSSQISDPASQAAAAYLVRLALRKGSKDNITVIVIDLKRRKMVKDTRPNFEHEKVKREILTINLSYYIYIYHLNSNLLVQVVYICSKLVYKIYKH